MHNISAEHVRQAGGIVHRDGNVFFTNIEQLNAALALASAIPSPAAANTADSDDFLAGVKACSINDPDCEACQ